MHYYGQISKLLICENVLKPANNLPLCPYTKAILRGGFVKLSLCRIGKGFMGKGFEAGMEKGYVPFSFLGHILFIP